MRNQLRKAMFCQMIAVQCEVVSNISSGSVTVTSDKTSTNAFYECAASYYILGQTVLTCLDTGLWDNVPPKCGKRLFNSSLFACIFFVLYEPCKI